MLKDGTASGRAPVTGDGPFGKMEAAGGFDLSDRGKIVHFHGPAHLTMNPKDKTASAPAQPQPVAQPAPAPKAKPAP